ncbi:MAG: RHS repeat domain-containing protein, partial [Anaerovoracaceae bacterium]
YGYDPLGKMISFAEFNTSSIPTDTQIAAKRIQYTYTLDDQIAEIIYPSAVTNIQSLKFNYNQYKWLTSIDAKVGGQYKKLRNYEYDNNAKVIEIKDYRSFDQTSLFESKYSKTSFVYDELERLIEQQTVDSSSSAVKEQYNLSYDKNGNILREKIYSDYQDNAENGKIDETRVYSYNSLGRLIEAETTDHLSDDAVSIKNYEYDKVGNRTEELIDDEKTTYSYTSLNQLRVSKKQEEGGSLTTSNKDYSYDLNGNEIGVTDSLTGESRLSSFDAEDRLSTLIDKVNGNTMLIQTNEYNGNGQRIKKAEQLSSEDSNGSPLSISKQKNYFYQGSSVLYTEDKVGTAAEQISSFNLLGLSDNIIATERPNASAKSYYFYNKDVRGSSSNILDKEGTAKASYKYDEFGNTQSFGNLDNEIAYTGGIYDKNTQLYYLNARYYNPEEGRFISQDTFRGSKEDPGTWHLYTYCSNNPINYVDPSGHWNEKLHYTKTVEWANSIPKAKRYSAEIGNSNRNVDLPLIRTGDAWHGRAGARAKAKKYIKKAKYWYNKGFKFTAATRLGQALHTWQDIFAHRRVITKGTVKKPTKWATYFNDDQYGAWKNAVKGSNIQNPTHLDWPNKRHFKVFDKYNKAPDEVQNIVKKGTIKRIKKVFI